VEDVKYTNPNQPVRPMMFLSAFQSPEYDDPSMRNVMLRSMMLRSIVIRTMAGASNLEPAIRSAIAEVSADVNVSWVRPLAIQVSGNFRIQRLLSRLTSLYGGLALILTALGLYGVTAYGVARRTREIGVRMALGAGRSGIMRSVIGGPLIETIVGLAIGLPLAMVVGRALGSQLYGLAGQNPLVWSLTIGVLVLTSILAAALPARRAASIDPARALRGE
jgi:ABC-type antimicrobial peptide transport system permease subunit